MRIICAPNQGLKKGWLWFLDPISIQDDGSDEFDKNLFSDQEEIIDLLKDKNEHNIVIHYSFFDILLLHIRFLKIKLLIIKTYGEKTAEENLHDAKITVESDLHLCGWWDWS